MQPVPSGIAVFIIQLIPSITVRIAFQVRIFVKNSFIQCIYHRFQRIAVCHPLIAIGLSRLIADGFENIGKLRLCETGIQFLHDGLNRKGIHQQNNTVRIAEIIQAVIVNQ